MTNYGLNYLITEMKQSHLFCQYLRDADPASLQEALDKFKGIRTKTQERITYTFPDGSTAFMERSKPGILTHE